MTKEHDFDGGNDPYAYFLFNGKPYQTRYITNAGLTATWNEKFNLGEMSQDSSIIIEVWDKDWVSSDFIGQTALIEFEKYPEGNTVETLDLFNANGQNEGELLKIRVTKTTISFQSNQSDEKDNQLQNEDFLE